MIAVIMAGWSITELAIAIVVIAAVAGIVYLVLTKVFGVVPPQWFIQILWIVVAAFVAIAAIRLVASM